MRVKRGVPDKARAKWTENARLQLIQAVIQVEADIMKQAYDSTVEERWERINDLLPPELQGRQWNALRQRYYHHKCRRVFDELLKTYRDPLRECIKCPFRYKLTKRVHEMMKKREDLLNAGISNHAESALNLRTSDDSVSPSSRLVNCSRQFPSTSSRSLNTHSNQGHSLERRSKCTAAQRTATFLSEQVNDFAEARCSDKKARGIETSTHLDRKRKEELRHNLDRFSGCARKCSVTQNKLASPSLGPPSQSASNFKDPGDTAESSVLPEDQSQAHYPSKERDFTLSQGPPCYKPRASSSVRKSNPRRLPRRHI